jgi:hypothetical protein
MSFIFQAVLALAVLVVSSPILRAEQVIGDAPGHYVPLTQEKASQDLEQLKANSGNRAALAQSSAENVHGLVYQDAALKAKAVAPKGEGDSSEPLPLPEAPTNFTAVQMSSWTVKLLWDAPTSGPAPAYYRVYINGKMVHETPGPDYWQFPVNPGESYAYSIVSVNANGDVAPAGNGFVKSADAWLSIKAPEEPKPVPPSPPTLPDPKPIDPMMPGPQRFQMGFFGSNVNLSVFDCSNPTYALSDGEISRLRTQMAVLSPNQFQGISKIQLVQKGQALGTAPADTLVVPVDPTAVRTARDVTDPFLKALGESFYDNRLTSEQRAALSAIPASEQRLTFGKIFKEYVADGGKALAALETQHPTTPLLLSKATAELLVASSFGSAASHVTSLFYPDLRDLAGPWRPIQQIFGRTHKFITMGPYRFDYSNEFTVASISVLGRPPVALDTPLVLPESVYSGVPLFTGF